MKNCILIFALSTLLSPVAFGQPPTVIDNSVVHIVFDHDKGGIDALTYKYGSNHNILYPYWNQGGLGRLGYLGEPGQNETGTVVTDYDIQADHASFTYENPLYGTKIFDISWSASGGVEILLTFNFSTADDGRETRGIWEPGGNNDGNDYITVLKTDESEQTFHYWYPGPWTLIWEGNAYGTKMWDADYDERIGYRSECYLFTRFANGASADGPYHLMDQAGTYTLYFAVKNSAAFDSWFNGFTNTGQPCEGGEPPEGCYYLQPCHLYLTEGSTGETRLQVKDESGEEVNALPEFKIVGLGGKIITGFVEVDDQGYVTAQSRELENSPTQHGAWIQATVNGKPVSNSCIVRVLSEDYSGVSYGTEQTNNTIVHYPADPNYVDLSNIVNTYNVGDVNQYAYTIQSTFLEGVQPFGDCGQIFQVDFGETIGGTVYGMAGNPIRLGWNIETDEKPNGFLHSESSPNWFVYYHELGHNFMGHSSTFLKGLDMKEAEVNLYSEAMASALYLATADKILSNSDSYPLGAAKTSMENLLNHYETEYLCSLRSWLLSGADFSKIDPDIVDGIWLAHKNTYCGDFESRFFEPFKPQHEDQLKDILEDVDGEGENGRHTFFAALVSAACDQDLSQIFRDWYHFEIVQSLFDSAYDTLYDNEESILTEGSGLPAAYIDSPPNDMIIEEGVPFDLSGHASCPGDVTVPCDRLTWWVDDVWVGSGCSINDLPINQPGDYVITLMVNHIPLSQVSITVQVTQCSDPSGQNGPHLDIPPDGSAGGKFEPFESQFKSESELDTLWVLRNEQNKDPGPQDWVTDSYHLSIVEDPGADDTSALRMRVTRPSAAELSKGVDITTAVPFGYGTYTSRMRFSADDGVVAGAFTYNSPEHGGLGDYSEIDFEILSRMFNCTDGPILCDSWQDRNEELGIRVDSSFLVNSDQPTVAQYNKYTFVWLPNRVDYYLEYDHLGTVFEFVPWEKAPFHFIIWSGDPEFSRIVNVGDEGFLVVDYFKYDPLNQANTLELVAMCPVTLQVTDPNSRITTMGHTEIPNTIHERVYIDPDSDLDERVVIFGPLSGNYLVSVMPETGAPPEETYSLLAIHNDDTTFLALDQTVAEIPPEGYLVSTLDTGSIYGVVCANSVSLLGVPVDLYDSTGTIIASTASDDSGFYQFPGLDNGYYSVSISTPLGYHAEEETKQVKVRGLAHEIDFELTKLEIASVQRSMGYWKHQVNVHLSGKGNAQESLADMSSYMSLVEEHFNNHPTNPITIFEVPQPADQTDSLEALQELLTVNVDGTMNDRAKQQLIALILNVVSLKLHQTTPISEDNATVSQAITYCNQLITDSDPANDELAKDIADQINNGILVASEVIPLTTPEIAYKGGEHEIAQNPNLPEEFSLEQNYPNPFNPICEIGYALPTDCQVKLNVYNILGQKVRVLVDEYQSAGNKSVTWDGRDDQGQEVTSGVYFYRIEAGDFVQSKKMVLMK